MKSLVIGVIAATIAVYMWGFLYWGLSPLPYMGWSQSTDDVAAGAALLEHFPTRGTYFLPSRAQDVEMAAALYEAGPVAMVHMLAPQGVPQHDSSVMLQGLVLNLVSVTLIACLLCCVRQALPGYLARVGVVALAGLAAAVFVDFGDAVWWRTPWEWKIHQAAYTVTAWCVIGLVLALFIRPAAPQAS